MSTRGGILYGITCGLVAALLTQLVAATTSGLDPLVQLGAMFGACGGTVLAASGDAAELARRRD